MRISLFCLWFWLSIGVASLKASELIGSYHTSAFSPKEPAAKNDWVFFKQSPAAWRSQFWHYFSRQGYTFKDWAWSWRLAWLQTCAMTTEAWCEGLLMAGLYDQAMVVRAKAAEIWGQRLAGSENTQAGQLLAKAFTLPTNNKGKRPMFVKYRILFALKSIGGKANLQAAAELAKTHPETLAYWQRLSS